MNDTDRQMWACTVCEVPRQWGVGEPEWTDVRPWLNCEGACQTVTRHAFALTLPLGERSAA